MEFEAELLRAVHERGFSEPAPAIATATDCIFGHRMVKSCGKRWMIICRNGAIGAVQPPAACQPDKCPGFRSRLRHLGVFTSLQEGAQVWQTLASAQVAAENTGADLRMALVDDGSTDGSCDFAKTLPNVALVRHDETVGLGKSRNEGAMASPGYDSVSFHDAHMRFPVGVFAHLGRETIRQRYIVQAGSRGLSPKSGFKAWGCRLLYPPPKPEYVIQPKWYPSHPPFGTRRSDALMGAEYLLSAPIVEELMRPTGRLWENTYGSWGASEELLSIKAFLLGIPIYTYTDWLISHLYRDAKNIPAGAPDRGQTYRLSNLAFGLAVLLGRDEVHARLGDELRKQMRRPGQYDDAIEASKEIEVDRSLWVRSVDDVFNELFRDDPE